MSTRHVQAAMRQLAAEADGRPLADETSVRGGATRRYTPGAVGGFFYWLADVMIDAAGRLVLIEVNGSNGAGTCVHDGDKPRVRHMVETFMSRSNGAPLAILAHQRGTPCLPEILSRAAAFAEALERASGTRVGIVRPGEAGDANGISIVVGPIDDIVPHLEVRQGHLFHADREARFATNVNMCAALLRAGKLSKREGQYAIDSRVFHDGQAGPTLVHDKALQQVLCESTAFHPLAFQECWSLDDAAVAAVGLTSISGASICKMNAGSGGSGIVAIQAGTSVRDAKAAILQSFSDADLKYGDLGASAFPVRVFEFAWAAPYKVGEQTHRWDLRVEIIGRPGFVEVTPLSARIADDPIEGPFTPASVIVNLTGSSNLKRVIDPLRLATGIGYDSSVLGRISDACAEWASNAFLYAEERSPGRAGTPNAKQDSHPQLREPSTSSF